MLRLTKGNSFTFVETITFLTGKINDVHLLLIEHLVPITFMKGDVQFIVLTILVSTCDALRLSSNVNNRIN